MKQLLDIYAQIKNQQLIGRYFLYQDVLDEVGKLASSFFKVDTIGYSVLKQPIKKIQVGNGGFKILIWSQMHGNESTSTKAIFDFLNLIQLEPSLSESLLEKASIHIIPVLNPDGMLKYTRVNANGVDLNRDALNCEEPESKILRDCIASLVPDFCFNMHGQRTIFSAGLNHEPATLSFLSPSVNEERSVTSVRKKVMQLIVSINESLQQVIPNKVGRYDDGFNLNCTGDYFQSKGIPVVLFESGHFPNDYDREKVRVYTLIALFKGVISLVNNESVHTDYRKYFDIPQNQKLFYDVIIRNLQIKQKIYSFAIQYKEILVDGKLIFLPLIAQVGGLESFWGHKEIDAKGKKAKFNGAELTEIPILGIEFILDELVID